VQPRATDLHRTEAGRYREAVREKVEAQKWRHPGEGRDPAFPSRGIFHPFTSPGLDPGVFFPGHEKDARIKSAQGEWGENAPPHHPLAPTQVGERAGVRGPVRNVQRHDDASPCRLESPPHPALSPAARGRGGRAGTKSVLTLLL
jgi:hypothetical protein